MNKQYYYLIHLNEKLTAIAIKKEDNHIQLGCLNCIYEQNLLTFVKFPDWLAILLNILYPIILGSNNLTIYFLWNRYSSSTHIVSNIKKNIYFHLKICYFARMYKRKILHLKQQDNCACSDEIFTASLILNNKDRKVTRKLLACIFFTFAGT